jgi:hypothetical protein
MFKKIIAFLLSFCFAFEQIGFAQIAGQMDISGRMSSLMGSMVYENYRPVHLRYLSYDQLNNDFKLLLDKGSVKEAKPEVLENTASDLLQYFFVGIALPNDAFWVNLRPDSPKEMINDDLGKTDMGKIMLEADLQLKKDTAKYTSPDNFDGREYWDKLYKRAEELYGSQNLTIPTLTRPWIVPDEIIVREAQGSAYIYKATLKVMLEQDYLKGDANYSFPDEKSKLLNEYSSQLIRETIIPKLTREVNSSKRYAPLRQVYYSLILAQWFKQSHKDAKSQVTRKIDRKDLTNLISKTKWDKNNYFKAYQKSFKDGEYNIRENQPSAYGQTIRTYFSGGVEFNEIGAKINRIYSVIKELPNAFQFKLAALVANLDGIAKMDQSLEQKASGITIGKPGAQVMPSERIGDKIQQEDTVSQKVDGQDTIRNSYLLDQVLYGGDSLLLQAADSSNPKKMVSQFFNKATFYIQNNRHINRKSFCTGRCWFCMTKTFPPSHRLLETSPTALADATAIVNRAIELGFGKIQLSGEDTLDDLESFWAMVDACKDKSIEFTFFTHGFYLLQNHATSKEFFQELKTRLGSTKLHITLSWDPEKVSRAKNFSGFAGNEDAVFSAIAEVVHNFREVFPREEVAPGDKNEEKYSLNIDAHDLGTNEQAAAMKEYKAFHKRIAETLAKNFGQTEKAQLYTYAEFAVLGLYTPEAIQVAQARGRLVTKFKTVAELLTKISKVQRGLCHYDPFFDMAMSEMVTCLQRHEYPRRAISADNFAEVLMKPFFNPRSRHLYLGEQKKRREALVKQLAFALALKPELAEELQVSFEEIEAVIFSDEELMTSIELLYLLDDILRIPEKGDKLFTPFRIPAELADALKDPKALRALLKYYSEYAVDQPPVIISLLIEEFKNDPDSAVSLLGKIMATMIPGLVRNKTVTLVPAGATPKGFSKSDSTRKGQPLPRPQGDFRQELKQLLSPKAPVEDRVKAFTMIQTLVEEQYDLNNIKDILFGLTAPAKLNDNELAIILGAISSWAVKDKILKNYDISFVGELLFRLFDQNSGFRTRVAETILDIDERIIGIRTDLSKKALMVLSESGIRKFYQFREEILLGLEPVMKLGLIRRFYRQGLMSRAEVSQTIDSLDFSTVIWENVIEIDRWQEDVDLFVDIFERALTASGEAGFKRAVIQRLGRTQEGRNRLQKAIESGNIHPGTDYRAGAEYLDALNELIAKEDTKDFAREKLNGLPIEFFERKDIFRTMAANRYEETLLPHHTAPEIKIMASCINQIGEFDSFLVGWDKYWELTKRSNPAASDKEGGAALGNKNIFLSVLSNINDVLTRNFRSKEYFARQKGISATPLSKGQLLALRDRSVIARGNNGTPALDTTKHDLWRFTSTPLEKVSAVFKNVIGSDLPDYFSSLSRKKTNVRVLEIGCGDATALEGLSQKLAAAGVKNVSLFGLGNMYFSRWAEVADKKIKLILDDIDYLSEYFKAGEIHVIYSYWGLNNLPGENLTPEEKKNAMVDHLKKLYPFLAPGGKIIMTTYIGGYGLGDDFDAMTGVKFKDVVDGLKGDKGEQLFTANLNGLPEGINGFEDTAVLTKAMAGEGGLFLDFLRGHLRGPEWRDKVVGDIKQQDILQHGIELFVAGLGTWALLPGLLFPGAVPMLTMAIGLGMVTTGLAMWYFHRGAELMLPAERQFFELYSIYRNEGMPELVFLREYLSALESDIKNGYFKQKFGPGMQKKVEIFYRKDLLPALAKSFHRENELKVLASFIENAKNDQQDRTNPIQNIWIGFLSFWARRGVQAAAAQLATLSLEQKGQYLSQGIRDAIFSLYSAGSKGNNAAIRGLLNIVLNSPNVALRKKASEGLAGIYDKYPTIVSKMLEPSIPEISREIMGAGEMAETLSLFLYITAGLGSAQAMASLQKILVQADFDSQKCPFLFFNRNLELKSKLLSFILENDKYKNDTKLSETIKSIRQNLAVFLVSDLTRTPDQDADKLLLYMLTSKGYSEYIEFTNIFFQKAAELSSKSGQEEGRYFRSFVYHLITDPARLKELMSSKEVAISLLPVIEKAANQGNNYYERINPVFDALLKMADTKLRDKMAKFLFKGGDASTVTAKADFIYEILRSNMPEYCFSRTAEIFEKAQMNANSTKLYFQGIADVIRKIQGAKAISEKEWIALVKWYARFPAFFVDDTLISILMSLLQGETLSSAILQPYGLSDLGILDSDSLDTKMEKLRKAVVADPKITKAFDYSQPGLRYVVFLKLKNLGFEINFEDFEKRMQALIEVEKQMPGSFETLFSKSGQLPVAEVSAIGSKQIQPADEKIFYDYGEQLRALQKRVLTIDLKEWFDPAKLSNGVRKSLLRSLTQYAKDNNLNLEAEAIPEVMEHLRKTDFLRFCEFFGRVISNKIIAERARDSQTVMLFRDLIIVHALEESDLLGRFEGQTLSNIGDELYNLIHDYTNHLPAVLAFKNDEVNKALKNFFSPLEEELGKAHKAGKGEERTTYLLSSEGFPSIFRGRAHIIDCSYDLNANAAEFYDLVDNAIMRAVLRLRAYTYRKGLPFTRAMHQDTRYLFVYNEQGKVQGYIGLFIGQTNGWKERLGLSAPAKILAIDTINAPNIDGSGLLTQVYIQLEQVARQLGCEGIALPDERNLKKSHPFNYPNIETIKQMPVYQNGQRIVLQPLHPQSWNAFSKLFGKDLYNSAEFKTFKLLKVPGQQDGGTAQPQGGGMTLDELRDTIESALRKDLSSLNILRKAATDNQELFWAQAGRLEYRLSKIGSLLAGKEVIPSQSHQFVPDKDTSSTNELALWRQKYIAVNGEVSIDRNKPHLYKAYLNPRPESFGEALDLAEAILKDPECPQWIFFKYLEENDFFGESRKNPMKAAEIAKSFEGSHEKKYDSDFSKIVFYAENSEDLRILVALFNKHLSIIEENNKRKIQAYPGGLSDTLKINDLLQIGFRSRESYREGPERLEVMAENENIVSFFEEFGIRLERQNRPAIKSRGVGGGFLAKSMSREFKSAVRVLAQEGAWKFSVEGETVKWQRFNQDGTKVLEEGKGEYGNFNFANQHFALELTKNLKRARVFRIKDIKPKDGVTVEWDPVAQDGGETEQVKVAVDQLSDVPGGPEKITQTEDLQVKAVVDQLGDVLSRADNFARIEGQLIPIIEKLNNFSPEIVSMEIVNRIINGMIIMAREENFLIDRKIEPDKELTRFFADYILGHLGKQINRQIFYQLMMLFDHAVNDANNAGALMLAGLINKIVPKISGDPELFDYARQAASKEFKEKIILLPHQVNGIPGYREYFDPVLSKEEKFKFIAGGAEKLMRDALQKIKSDPADSNNIKFLRNCQNLMAKGEGLSLEEIQFISNYKDYFKLAEFSTEIGFDFKPYFFKRTSNIRDLKLRKQLLALEQNALLRRRALGNILQAFLSYDDSFEAFSRLLEDIEKEEFVPDAQLFLLSTLSNRWQKAEYEKNHIYDRLVAATIKIIRSSRNDEQKINALSILVKLTNRYKPGQSAETVISFVSERLPVLSKDILAEEDALQKNPEKKRNILDANMGELEYLLRALSGIAGMTVNSSDPLGQALTAKIIKILIDTADSKTFGKNIAAESVSNLGLFVAKKNTAVLDWFVRQLTSDDQQKQHLAQLLAGNPGNNELQDILTSEIVAKEQKIGYLFLLRFQDRRDLLSEIIREEKINIGLRLYAFALYCGQGFRYLDVDGKGGISSAFNEEELIRLMDYLTPESNDFIRGIFFQNKDGYEGLLNNIVLQDEVLKVYATAVLLVARQHAPQINSRDIVNTMAVIREARLRPYWDNAISNFVIGGLDLAKLQRPTALFLQVLAHEIMHNLLHDRYPMKNLSSGIMHEAVCDLFAMVFYESFANSGDRINREFEKQLFYQRDFEAVVGSNGNAIESHEGARAQLQLIRNFFDNYLLDLDVKRLMQVGFSALIAGNWDSEEGISRIFSEILRQYIKADSGGAQSAEYSFWGVAAKAGISSGGEFKAISVASDSLFVQPVITYSGIAEMFGYPALPGSYETGQDESLDMGGDVEIQHDGGNQNENYQDYLAPAGDIARMAEGGDIQEAAATFWKAVEKAEQVLKKYQRDPEYRQRIGDYQEQLAQYAQQVKSALKDNKPAWQKFAVAAITVKLEEITGQFDTSADLYNRLKDDEELSKDRTLRFIEKLASNLRRSDQDVSKGVIDKLDEFKKLLQTSVIDEVGVKYSPENFNVESELKKVLSKFDEKLRARVRIDGDAEIKTYKFYLSEIFQNLLDNGFKYADSDKLDQYIKISISEKNGRVIIAYEDNGQGMTKEVQEYFLAGQGFLPIRPGVQEDTTKNRTGEGTKTVLGYLKKLGGNGFEEFYSSAEVNTGTRFKMAIDQRIDKDSSEDIADRYSTDKHDIMQYVTSAMGGVDLLLQFHGENNKIRELGDVLQNAWIALEEIAGIIPKKKPDADQELKDGGDAEATSVSALYESFPALKDKIKELVEAKQANALSSKLPLYYKIIENRGIKRNKAAMETINNALGIEKIHGQLLKDVVTGKGIVILGNKGVGKSTITQLLATNQDAIAQKRYLLAGEDSIDIVMVGKEAYAGVRNKTLLQSFARDVTNLMVGKVIPRIQDPEFLHLERIVYVTLDHGQDNKVALQDSLKAYQQILEWENMEIKDVQGTIKRNLSESMRTGLAAVPFIKVDVPADKQYRNYESITLRIAQDVAGQKFSDPVVPGPGAQSQAAPAAVEDQSQAIARDLKKKEIESLGLSPRELDEESVPTERPYTYGQVDVKELIYNQAKKIMGDQVRMDMMEDLYLDQTMTLANPRGNENELYVYRRFIDKLDRINSAWKDLAQDIINTSLLRQKYGDDPELIFEQFEKNEELWMQAEMQWFMIFANPLYATEYMTREFVEQQVRDRLTMLYPGRYSDEESAKVVFAVMAIESKFREAPNSKDGGPSFARDISFMVGEGLRFETWKLDPKSIDQSKTPLSDSEAWVKLQREPFLAELTREIDPATYARLEKAFKESQKDGGAITAIAREKFANGLRGSLLVWGDKIAGNEHNKLARVQFAPLRSGKGLIQVTSNGYDGYAPTMDKELTVKIKGISALDREYLGIPQDISASKAVNDLLKNNFLVIDDRLVSENEEGGFYFDKIGEDNIKRVSDLFGARAANTAGHLEGFIGEKQKDLMRELPIVSREAPRGQISLDSFKDGGKPVDIDALKQELEKRERELEIIARQPTSIREDSLFLRQQRALERIEEIKATIAATEENKPQNADKGAAFNDGGVSEKLRQEISAIPRFTFEMKTGDLTFKAKVKFMQEGTRFSKSLPVDLSKEYRRKLWQFLAENRFESRGMISPDTIIPNVNKDNILANNIFNELMANGFDAVISIGQGLVSVESAIKEVNGEGVWEISFIDSGPGFGNGLTTREKATRPETFGKEGEGLRLVNSLLYVMTEKEDNIVKTRDEGSGRTVVTINLPLRWLDFNPQKDGGNPVSDQAKEGADSQNPLGGVDFRGLPIVVQPGAMAAGLNQLPSVNIADLDGEWQQIEKMAASDMVPSTQRLKEFLGACCSKGALDKYAGNVLACIADIMRMEEEKAKATEPALRDILILLESNRPENELQQSLSFITVTAGQPQA